MESYILVALCLFALVALSQQHDDMVLSLKEAALARLANRQRGKVVIGGEYVTPKGRRLRVSVDGHQTSRGSRLRINGEYVGANGGSVMGVLNRDSRGGMDFFRGAARRGRTDAAFDARLPSGAGFGGRANMRSRLNAGLTGGSGIVGGRFEGGINDAYGNHFGGGFQGGFQGSVNIPVVAAGYVAGPNRHHDFLVG